MKQRVGVLDYGVAGNIFSITRALENVGVYTKIVSSPADFAEIDKLVIPGVGCYADGMNKLNIRKLIEPLNNYCLHHRKPVLGICLGMQIMSKIGYEYGETEGLGFLDAEVRKIECKGVVPHMGFNAIKSIKESRLLKGIDSDEAFYFMHSYELCNYTNVLALTNYVGHTFVSAIEKDNIFGVQFHPENSRDAGMQIFKNFISM